METSFAAVELKIGLLSRIVEELTTDGSASRIGNVAATTFAFVASLEATEKLRLVAWTTETMEIFLVTRKSAARSANRILCQVTTSTSHPVLVSSCLWKIKINVDVTITNAGRGTDGALRGKFIRVSGDISI